jgi:hypothetical protein
MEEIIIIYFPILSISKSSYSEFFILSSNKSKTFVLEKILSHKYSLKLYFLSFNDNFAKNKMQNKIFQKITEQIQTK